MLRLRPPIIIDIEASGFGPESYPIEIGVALDGGRKFCTLISFGRGRGEGAPGESQRAGAVRQACCRGRGPAERVAWSYTDGWVVDKPWLNRLFFAAGVNCEFSLSSLEMILSERQMEIWHPTKDTVLLELGDRRHRASFDAYLIRETWERTWSATVLPETAAG